LVVVEAGGGVSRTGLSVWAGDDVSEAFDIYTAATAVRNCSLFNKLTIGFTKIWKYQKLDYSQTTDYAPSMLFTQVLNKISYSIQH